MNHTATWLGLCRLPPPRPVLAAAACCTGAAAFCALRSLAASDRKGRAGAGEPWRGHQKPCCSRNALGPRSPTMRQQSQAKLSAVSSSS